MIKKSSLKVKQEALPSIGENNLGDLLLLLPFTDNAVFYIFEMGKRKLESSDFHNINNLPPCFPRGLMLQLNPSQTRQRAMKKLTLARKFIFMIPKINKYSFDRMETARKNVELTEVFRFH